MKIIISPAKKMRADCDDLPVLTMPVFLDRAEEVQAWLRTLSYAEAKKLWTCSDAIAGPAYEQLRTADLRRGTVPALLSYDGIAFTYMVPGVLEESALAYLQNHLLILSALYGVLRPFDGVVPYRLEMQEKAQVAGTRNLYEYWGDALYRMAVGEGDAAPGVATASVPGGATTIAPGRATTAAPDVAGDRVIVNLASKEDSRAVERYLQSGDRFVTCTFATRSASGKLVQKGVYCKMGRGEMVRYMATHAVEDPAERAGFDSPDWRYSEEHSSRDEFVFLRVEHKQR